jgi:hypothetical protein
MDKPLKRSDDFLAPVEIHVLTRHLDYGKPATLLAMPKTPVTFALCNKCLAESLKTILASKAHRVDDDHTCELCGKPAQYIVEV